MRRIILFSTFLLIFFLNENVFAQILWHETFDVPDKGCWANSSGQIIENLSGVSWSLDVSDCKFVDDGDFAKTVLTSGGRFEVLDSDGDVVFLSPVINISSYHAVNVSLKTSETGSNDNFSKKYIKAYYLIDNGLRKAFNPDSGAYGNWNNKVLEQKALSGSSMQLILVMNSSYANDKIVLDDIVVEGIDSTNLRPSKIDIINPPFFAFVNDTVYLSANVKNRNGEIVADKPIVLDIYVEGFEKLSFSYNNGVYEWKILPIVKGQIKATISASDTDIASAEVIMNSFEKNDVLLFEDFEDKLFQGCNFNASEWALSDELPINGKYSLKHIKQPSIEFSEFKYSGFGHKLDLSLNDYFISFSVKNGSWDPTNYNHFYLWLCEFQPGNEPVASSIDGYAIGVNAIGGTDLVSLWAVKNGVATDLLCATDFDWGENSVAKIDAHRTGQGEWTLKVIDLVSGASSVASVFYPRTGSIDQVSFNFNYTSTRSGLLWFDDFLMVETESSPFAISVNAENSNKVVVEFNKSVDFEKLSKNNFKIQGKSGLQYAVNDVEKISGSKLILFTETLTEPSLVFSANNIIDNSGNSGNTIGLEFKFVLEASGNDIVFTEIFADPTPSVGLPDAEFLEIYNRSEKFIDLAGFKLFVKNSEWKLPAKIIEPGEYLILCATSDSAKYSAYGKVLNMKSFPALLNSGTNIVLISTGGAVCDRLTYSDSWYNDKEKVNGGYSLERIDYDRYCGANGNWAASLSSNGGTPGKENSVSGSNPDSDPPLLLSVDIISKTKIVANFSESLDSLSATSKLNYFIKGISIKGIEYQLGNKFVEVELVGQLKANETYALAVKVADECGNVSSEQEADFIFAALVYGDIVINEVLFNPNVGGSDFVELFNRSGKAVDLAGLKLATRNDSLKPTSIYSLSKLHSFFPAKSILAFSNNTKNIEENYFVPYPEKLVSIDKLPAFNDDAGWVVLLNDSLEVLDEFVYNKNMHSSWLSDLNGVSLERLSTEKATNDKSNWHSASSLVGYATPGYENSQTEVEEGQETTIELDASVVSPNGDGFNDDLILNFKLDQTGYLANVYIFDANGREMFRLTKNDLVGNNNKVVYNLKKSNGELLPMGSYLVFAELSHPKVKKKKFKLAFLVTDNQ